MCGMDDGVGGWKSEKGGRAVANKNRRERRKVREIEKRGLQFCAVMGGHCTWSGGKQAASKKLCGTCGEWWTCDEAGKAEDVGCKKWRMDLLTEQMGTACFVPLEEDCPGEVG